MCEIIRTHDKKGTKYVLKMFFTRIMNFHNPNMLPLFTICKKGSSIKDQKRFLSRRSKKVPQLRNLYIKRFLNQETFICLSLPQVKGSWIIATIKVIVQVFELCISLIFSVLENFQQKKKLSIC